MRALSLLLLVWLAGCCTPQGSPPLAITLQTDGYWNDTSTGIWVPSTISITSTRWAVYQFTGLPLATGDTFATAFTLTLPGLESPNLPGTSPGTITAYTVVSRHSDPATGQGVRQYLLAALTSTTVSDSGPADWVIEGSLAYGASTASRTIAGAFNQGWRSVYRDSNNELARTVLIVVKRVSGNLVDGVSGTATLTVTEANARTGLSGNKYVADWKKGIGRPLLECPKSGFDIPRDEAVMDGYTRQLVWEGDYDPPLPRVKRRPYRPNRLGGPT